MILSFLVIGAIFIIQIISYFSLFILVNCYLNLVGIRYVISDTLPQFPIFGEMELKRGDLSNQKLISLRNYPLLAIELRKSQQMQRYSN